MAAVLDTAASIDGRELRSIRTRAAIIDAWLDLIGSGDLSPTAKGVADRAGIGLRTIFQHFSDMTALHQAAAGDFMDRVMVDAVHVDAELPLELRIDEIIADRSRLWDDLTPLRRASERQEWSSSGIHELISVWECFSSASVMRIFAAELQLLPERERSEVGQAVDCVLSWAHWNQLRQRRSLSPSVACSVMAVSQLRLLG
jgi:TetR/AcrR family transcriptional regulator of autoinduction and epiphytic fitness